MPNTDNDVTDELIFAAGELTNAFTKQFEIGLDLFVEGTNASNQTYILKFSETTTDANPGIGVIGSIRSNWLVRTAPAYGFSPVGVAKPPYSPETFEFATPDFTLVREEPEVPADTGSIPVTPIVNPEFDIFESEPEEESEPTDD